MTAYEEAAIDGSVSPVQLSFIGASGNFPLLVFPGQVIHGEGVKGCVSVCITVCVYVFEQLGYC